jgi:drug/metabolite transporter (DMT)-like permease
MLTVLLALAAAASYSGSDYAAGLAAREADVVRVTVSIQVVYCLAILLVVPFASTQRPSWSALAWGALAGVCGLIAALALYRGFRYASFSVVSSLSAVCSATFCVLAGLLLGERPGPAALAGIVIALPAIAAVSVSPDHGATAEAGAAAGAGAGDNSGGGRVSAGRRVAADRHGAGVAWGLIGGIGFGLFYTSLSRAGSAADLWPLAAAALAGLATVTTAAALTGQLKPAPAGTGRLCVLSGVTAATGVWAYFLATHHGLLAIAAVITSLYPAGTIMLARFLLTERLTRTRIAGLGLAAVSVALIAAASAH